MKANLAVIITVFLVFSIVLPAYTQEEQKQERSGGLTLTGKETVSDLQELLAKNPDKTSELVPALEATIVRAKPPTGDNPVVSPIELGATPPFTGVIVVYPKRAAERVAYVEAGDTRFAVFPGCPDFPPLYSNYDEKGAKKYGGALTISQEKGIILEYKGDRLLPFINNSSGGVLIRIYKEVGETWTGISNLFMPRANGSIYRFQGTIKLFDRTFIGEGDEMNRLTFQITDQGLTYLRGTGKVILKDGSEKKFGYE
jgi:hypothetical protein